MIRINLLPPELRKRQRSGVGGEFLGMLAGVAASAAAVVFWAWITYARIPYAEQLVRAAEDTFLEVQQEANDVRQLERQVASAEDRLEKLHELIIGKVRWAPALNDFATMLSNEHWSAPGFRVAATSLDIAPHQAAATSRTRPTDDAAKQFTFQWQMVLLGNEFEKSGDYISAFFEDVKVSDWWRHYGFVGDPVRPYRGDVPSYEENLEKVAVSLSLLWVRDQQLQTENRSVTADNANDDSEVPAAAETEDVSEAVGVSTAEVVAAQEGV